MPKKDVAKRLGHTPEVLDRTYTHSDEEDDKKLLKEIEDKFYNNSYEVFNISSVVSIIAGNVENDFKKENYDLMDYITKEKITNENVNLYLDSCKEYLLSLYPVLDIFKYDEVANNQEVFKNKIQQFESIIGKDIKVKPNPNGIKINSINI